LERHEGTVHPAVSFYMEKQVNWLNKSVLKEFFYKKSDTMEGENDK